MGFGVVLIVFSPNLSSLKGDDGTYIILLMTDGFVDFPDINFELRFWVRLMVLLMIPLVLVSWNK
jgi:hypothetical protein